MIFNVFSSRSSSKFLTDILFKEKRIFALLPNLKHLSIWSLNQNTGINPIILTKINTNLESLKLWNGGGNADSINTFAYFPNLKEFSIGQYWDSDMCGFITRHSNTLEKITIEVCDDLKYPTILMLSTLFFKISESIKT